MTDAKLPGLEERFADVRGVRMRYPPGVTTVMDADLTVAGTTERSQVSGEIRIQRAGINANFGEMKLIFDRQSRILKQARGWEPRLGFPVETWRYWFYDRNLGVVFEGGIQPEWNGLLKGRF